jgi:regulator of replication initiation timing
MTKKERNKVTMFSTVSKWFADNKESIVALPNLEETLETFGTHLNDIKEVDSDVVSDTTGLTADKEVLKESLSGKSLSVARMLKAYATFVGDKELLNSIDFTKSQLHYAADQVLQSRAALLLKTAKTIGDSAQAYGLTPEVIGEMETTLTAFSNQVTNPRQAVIAKKDSREKMAELISQTDNLLSEKLDVLMDLMGITKPELLNQYKAARVIVDR